MAYARFDSGSDIYLYASDGVWTCCMCKLTPQDVTGFNEDTALSTLRGVLDHLNEHAAAGHLVHESTLIRVKKELESQRTPIQEFTEEVFDEPAAPRRRPDKKVTLRRKE